MLVGRLSNQHAELGRSRVPGQAGDCLARLSPHPLSQLLISRQPLEVRRECVHVPGREEERGLAESLTVWRKVAERHWSAAGGRFDGRKPESFGERRDHHRRGGAVETGASSRR